MWLLLSSISQAPFEMRWRGWGTAAAYLAEKCSLFQAKQVAIKQNLCSHFQTPFLRHIHVEHFVVLCAPFPQIMCPVEGNSKYETRETTKDKACREN